MSHLLPKSKQGWLRNSVQLREIINEALLERSVAPTAEGHFKRVSETSTNKGYYVSRVWRIISAPESFEQLYDRFYEFESNPE